MIGVKTRYERKFLRRITRGNAPQRYPQNVKSIGESDIPLEPSAHISTPPTRPNIPPYLSPSINPTAHTAANVRSGTIPKNVMSEH